MAETLFLTPTRYERDLLVQSGLKNLDVQLCGFGLVEAGVNTAALIEKHQPDQIVLIGLAGVYSPFANLIGTAQCFQSVSVWGIGSYRKGTIVSGVDLGFIDKESESLDLHCPNSLDRVDRLVSIALTGLFPEVDILNRFPDAAGEDMEGYAVARAAEATSTPVTILRGISNLVGQPFDHWEIEKSVTALVKAIETTAAE